MLLLRHSLTIVQTLLALKQNFFMKKNKIYIVYLFSTVQPVTIFGLRFAFFTHISGKKRTVSKYVR